MFLYRASYGTMGRRLPPTCLSIVAWVNCGKSVSERTHCDDDLAGLLSPSRQPSVADVSTGGRKSLLVEAIALVDSRTSFNQSAETLPAVRIARPDLTKGSNRTFLWFPNVRILRFPRPDCC